MSFFFIDEQLALGVRADIAGEAAHHIGTVRRIKKGEEVELQDTLNKRFVVRIEEVSRRSLTVLPVHVLDTPPSPARTVTLLQAYIAEQKLDLVLQKATELGAAHIVVWQAEYSPHEISSERMTHKYERFVAIMRNACEQSGRPAVPTLTFVPSLEKALTDATHITPVCLDAGGTAPLPAGDCSLIVGPEGGFSEAERALCVQKNIPVHALSTYTLRAETAAIAGLAKTLA